MPQTTYMKPAVAQHYVLFAYYMCALSRTDDSDADGGVLYLPEPKSQRRFRICTLS